jgi:hypothetical protein
MASGAAAAPGASAVAAGQAAPSRGATSGLGGVASGSGPPGPDSTGAGAGEAPAGVVADFPAGEDGAGWGPDPPAGASPTDALDASEERGLAHTNGVRAQKLNGVKKISKKAAYMKSNHSQPPRAIGGISFPTEDSPVLWWGSPAAGAPGGGCGVCGLGSGGGGGVAGRCAVGGGGGISCGCCCCGGGGGAQELLGPSASTVFWRLGAGSTTKEPSPRWSLRDLDLSSWLLRAVAAPRASSPLRAGVAPTLCLWRRSGSGSFPFPFPAGVGPPWLDPPGPWLARCWRSGEAPGIWIPRLGSPPTCRTARPPSSRVGIDARTADHNAWSSHRALIPLGRTSDSRLNASPVIVRSDASSSSLEKLVPGPRAILQQSLGPVYMQAILDRC